MTFAKMPLAVMFLTLPFVFCLPRASIVGCLSWVACRASVPCVVRCGLPAVRLYPALFTVGCPSCVVRHGLSALRWLLWVACRGLSALRWLLSFLFLVYRLKVALSPLEEASVYLYQGKDKP